MGFILKYLSARMHYEPLFSKPISFFERSLLFLPLSLQSNAKYDIIAVWR